MTIRDRSSEMIVAVSSAAWGLFWLPLRALADLGLTSGWLTLAQFVAPLLILSPIAVWRGWGGRPVGFRLMKPGFFLGLAMALYFESLLLTDVARVLLLFYLTPAWGTLLEVFVLKRPLTRWRMLALGLSFAGLVIIIGPNAIAFEFNVGDVMALCSGMLFAYGALQMRLVAERASVYEVVFAYFFYGGVAALGLGLLSPVGFGSAPSAVELRNLWPWLFLVSVVFLIPTIAGILGESRRIDPGRLGVLLQLEVIVGIGSAVLLAAEPFGLQQVLGALTVFTAGMVEVVGGRLAISAEIRKTTGRAVDEKALQE